MSVVLRARVASVVVRVLPPWPIYLDRQAEVAHASAEALHDASVMSDRLVRVAADGTQSVFLEDCDRSAVDAAMQRWPDGRFGREDINPGTARGLGNISSVAFGGTDMRTLYLGSLAGERIATIRSPVAGAIPPHWHF